MTKSFLIRSGLLSVAAIPVLAFVPVASQESAPKTPDPTPGIFVAPKADIDKIRDEGLNRSQVMKTIGYLTDVIGPRLSASPGLHRANVWTRDTLEKWGMQNAHLEEWGPFGRSWVLNEYELTMTSPERTPLIGYPKAWSPSTAGTIDAEVIYLDATRDTDLEKYKGKLKDKIVLISKPRDIIPDFEPVASRFTKAQLDALSTTPAPTPTPTPATDRPNRLTFATKRSLFLKEEGVALVIDNSTKGTGGTLFVAGASVPQDEPLKTPDTRGRTALQSYHQQASGRVLPQLTLSSEHYNRLIRLLDKGEKVRLTAKIKTTMSNRDLMCYNTIAEIPGSDLKDEVVMVGGHLDSWHSSTGATDNAAGSGVAMEALRIIQSAGLKPRRTIRVALWTGEEQGLLGSNAYVKKHFAFLPNNGTNTTPLQDKQAEYEKLSVYFNLDNGTGKVRGVYNQGNSAAGAIFSEWLKPFNDLEATTVASRNAGGTDHLAFDRVGLPGFQFIQDRIDYQPKTHHSNQDNFDRIQPNDMKQAATIMAAFAYQAAMMDEKMPRKPRP